MSLLWRRRRSLVLALALCLSLAACGSGGSSTSTGGDGAPQRGGDVVVLIHEPTTPNFNKLTAIIQGVFWCTEQVFETLTLIDREGKTQPLLAKSWEASPDGLTWTFRLQENVTFSDGKPLTADDVVFTLTDARRAENPQSFLLTALDSISAADPKTVKVKLKSPYPLLPEVFAGFNFGVVPKDWGGKAEAAFYEDPVGTGPFMLDTTAWTKGTSVKLVRNPKYWQAGKPYLDSVSFKTVNDENQRVLQLRGNQAQVIFGPDVTKPAVQLQQTPGVTVHNVPAYRTSFLALNNSFAPFKDVHVRRAIALSLDREAIKKALFDFPIATGSYMPQKQRYHDPNSALPYDPARAKQELAQSTHPGGFAVELLVDAGSTQEKTLAQILQQQLAPLNIKLNIKQLDLGSRIEALFARKYQLALQDFNQVTGDPAEITGYAVDPTFQSFWTGYQDKALVDLAHRAAAEPDPERQKQLYSQTQRSVAEAAYVVVPYNLPDIWSTTSRLNGILLGLADAVDFTGAWLSATS